MQSATTAVDEAYRHSALHVRCALLWIRVVDVLMPQQFPDMSVAFVKQSPLLFGPSLARLHDAHAFGHRGFVLGAANGGRVAKAAVHDDVGTTHELAVRAGHETHQSCYV